MLNQVVCSKKINLGETVLGIELGSTRIKANLINKEHKVVGSGSYQWENQLINGIWTYSLEQVKLGLQSCFSSLKDNVLKEYGIELTTVGAIGISGMMHGYLPFDKAGNQLTEFRTWRNTICSQSAAILTSCLNANIPQRWSAAHLYQAVLNNEGHVDKIDFLTTLSGYIHWKLTGEKVLGIGDASGMFPIDSLSMDYDGTMLDKFQALVESKGLNLCLQNILPKVLKAGDCAGYLSEEGALFLDPSGTLQPGVPCAPPEGDAGTGMVATNAVKTGTGNISAGTSAFAMIVVDRSLGCHRELDMVTTPSGRPVAMVHCNNCSSDINAWVDLFAEFAAKIGAETEKNQLFKLLFNSALEGEADCGKLLSFNYISGEGITDVNSGRPLFIRGENSHFTLANFMRAQLYSSIATLKIGMDIITSEENLQIEKLYAHGGLFNTPIVVQSFLSAALAVPVTVMDTAGEGGPYGMALLAAYMMWRKENQSLEDYLEENVFSEADSSEIMASGEDIAGFNGFIENYKRALSVEKMALEAVK